MYLVTSVQGTLGPSVTRKGWPGGPSAPCSKTLDVTDAWAQGTASHFEESRPRTWVQAWQPCCRTPGAAQTPSQRHPAWDLDFLPEKQRAAGAKLNSRRECLLILLQYKTSSFTRSADS